MSHTDCILQTTRGIQCVQNKIKWLIFSMIFYQLLMTVNYFIALYRYSEFDFKYSNISGEHPLHAGLLREEVRDSVQRQCGDQIFLK